MLQSPKVTVLMSVFNGKQYLYEAVRSILTQTFPDFEFLIINDASTDESMDIIKSFNDHRIRVIENETNLGLTKSLNIGLEQARGQYIARMDCDDISLPDRLEKQAAWLDANPECAVVAAKTVLIDRDGDITGHWSDDLDTTTYQEIRSRLPASNCIAHPSVMMRASVVKAYRYNPCLKNSQDYDLWLRLCSDGLVIEKIDEVLLKYRVHGMSITSVSNRASSEMKVIRTKYFFLRARLAKIHCNIFDCKVLACLLQTILRFTIHRLQGIALQILKKILVGSGQFLGSIWPLPDSTLYFFFPFYHIGGAERVHADIVECVADQKPVVFFTNKSKNQKFKPLFEKNAVLFDISRFAEKRITSLICIGVLARHINRQPGVVILGCNTPFFYRLIPHLRTGVKCIDLLHAFGGGIEQHSLPVVEEIDKRVIINAKTVQDLSKQYAFAGLNRKLLDRVVLIENHVLVPEKFPEHQRHDSLRVLYVGRGSQEKRVHLIGRVAARCCRGGIPAEFIFIGDVGEAVEAECRGYCVLRGELEDKDELNRIYRDSDVLVLASSREGFPMVIMEAMAQGVVPVVTAAGGIPVHIKHEVNGILLPSEDENQIVDRMVETIKKLNADRNLLRDISYAAYTYASEKFGAAKFRAAYRELLI